MLLDLEQSIFKKGPTDAVIAGPMSAEQKSKPS
jgi:hypothetical protein